MAATAKVFMNNRSQAVRLPKEFQFSTSEVYIRKVGGCDSVAASEGLVGVFSFGRCCVRRFYEKCRGPSATGAGVFRASKGQEIALNG